MTEWQTRVKMETAKMDVLTFPKSATEVQQVNVTTGELDTV